MVFRMSAAACAGNARRRSVTAAGGADKMESRAALNAAAGICNELQRAATGKSSFSRFTPILGAPVSSGGRFLGTTRRDGNWRRREEEPIRC